MENIKEKPRHIKGYYGVKVPPAYNAEITEQDFRRNSGKA